MPGHADIALLIGKLLRRYTGTSTPAAHARYLHDAIAEKRVFTGEQVLHESVAALIRVAGCAGEVIINSHACGAAEIICDRENFISWFALAEQPLRVRTRRADRE